ncbi:hypothetical protein HAX54_008284 [Datura stramonium]|uniref:Uncharacterized protein n=1 Tax=Datura stramonium TaxID=4076 RepID=A0ABS8TCZ4_DATST|nr:hypothetical protein [Datura stramonium]
MGENAIDKGNEVGPKKRLRKVPKQICIQKTTNLVMVAQMVNDVVEAESSIPAYVNIQAGTETDDQHTKNRDVIYNGRIWFMWKAHLKVNIVDVKEQYIHCNIDDPGQQAPIYLQ